MKIDKYTIFLEVCRQRNLSRAAQTLGYTQSGISHMINRLENELNLTLFERSRSGAVLTAAGKELYPYFLALSQCQDNLNQAVQSLHNLQTGVLNIGTYSSISRHWLPKIIQRFRHDFPSVVIHFKEGGNTDIFQWLKEGRVDMGFLSAGRSREFEWIPLMKDPLLAVLPKDHPATGNAFPLEEFNGKSFIISAMGTDVDIHRILETYEIRPEIQYSAVDDYTIISMVACHLGISILPGLILKEQEKKVLTLPLKPFVTRELGIAVPSVEMASPVIKKFIDYTREYVQSSDALL